MQVGDDETVRCAAPLRERLLAGRRRVGFEAEDLELPLQHGEVHRMVVNDEELAAGRRTDRLRSVRARQGVVAKRARARRRGRERHADARAEAFSARDFDRAAHELDELARDGEPETGSAVAAAGIGFALLKGLEEAPLGVGAHADAGVLYAEAQRLPAVRAVEHLDLQADASGRRELDRIAHQVGEHLAQTRRIDEMRRPQRRIDAPREQQLLAARHVLERGIDALHQAGHRAGLGAQLQFPHLDLREVEDVVDQGEERAARFARRREHLPLIERELAVREQFQHADDRVHRRADLVAHGGDECALRLRARARGVA